MVKNTTEDFQAGPCGARRYGGQESTPQRPTAYLLRHRLRIVIHQGIVRLKITGSGNDKSGQPEISRHRDCGLSARKIGSLIAGKLESLRAHKLGHFSWHHLIIGILVLTTKTGKLLEIQHHLQMGLHMVAQFHSFTSHPKDFGFWPQYPCCFSVATFQHLFTKKGYRTQGLGHPLEIFRCVLVLARVCPA